VRATWCRSEPGVDRWDERKVTKFSQRKEITPMSQLASVIEKAADAFAREIIAVVKSASLQELLAMQGGTVPARRPGRPSKAAVAVEAKVRAKRRAKIKWPKCKHRGCTRNAWARGKGFCGEHFKASKAGKK
jgi:hypothetical protein